MNKKLFVIKDFILNVAVKEILFRLLKYKQKIFLTFQQMCLLIKTEFAQVKCHY